jgi:hypothetical protein
MAAPGRMIVLEFNELCAELIAGFMARGLLPGFRALYERSSAFATDAGEAPPNLEPWIQWPTVHSGMTYAEHRIYDLGDGYRLREKGVAALLSDAGIPVGIFGSMNVNYGALNGYFIPDPWHKLGKASPESLQPFYRVISRQVQESSREDAFTLPDMARFGWFMLRNGLTAGTVGAIARQLGSERLDPGVRWRRASVLDDVQYDLFRRLNARHRVRFATFFSNSTAHYQHYYWRNMQPEMFTIPPRDDEHGSLAGAIQHGYQSMDRLIRRALADYPDATIVLCTALSQRPWTDTTKCTFRPRSFESLFAFAQLDARSVTVKPVMAEQFHLVFASPDARQRAESALQDLFLEDRPLMTVRRESEDTLFGGCDIVDARLADGIVTRRRDGAQAPFGELFYMIHSMRSGHHDPRGLLWIGNGRHEVVAEPVSLADIAPTILKAFDVPKPAHMRGEALVPRVPRQARVAAAPVAAAVH